MVWGSGRFSDATRGVITTICIPPDRDGGRRPRRRRRRQLSASRRPLGLCLRDTPPLIPPFQGLSISSSSLCPLDHLFSPLSLLSATHCFYFGKYFFFLYELCRKRSFINWRNSSRVTIALSLVFLALRLLSKQNSGQVSNTLTMKGLAWSLVKHMKSKSTFMGIECSKLRVTLQKVSILVSVIRLF